VPGRYLFGAIGAAGLLLALGFSAFTERLPALLALPAVALGGLAVWLLPNVVMPAYAAPPPLAAGSVVPNPVDVVFGSMHLIGYRIDGTSVAPGGTLHVTLYWQALQPMKTSFTIGVHVVDATGAVLGGVDGLPGRGNLGTPLWKVGSTYADPYDLPVSAAAPVPQLGQLLIGVERRVPDPQPQNSGYLRPVPVAARTSSGQPVTPFLGRFRIGKAVTTQMAPAQYRFGDDLGLITANVITAAGGQVQVHLQLQSLRSPLPRLVLFAHLLGADGKVAAAAPDAEPLGNRYPTDLWFTGEIVDETLNIAAPASLPVGARQIEVGMYEQGKPQHRLPVTAADGKAQASNRVLLTTPSGAAR
jgi:hypothetical protein